jgi:hypothetical protein
MDVKKFRFCPIPLKKDRRSKRAHHGVILRRMRIVIHNRNWARSCWASLFLACGPGISGLWGQPASPAKPGPDVLLFMDGERLTGQFVKASGSSLTFKSEALGEITVDWSKVKELQSSVKVAVIPKGLRLRKPGDAANIAKGTLSVEDQQMRLAAEPPRSMPVAEAGQIIDQAGFENALTHQPGFFKAWKGALTIGAAVVSATQSSDSFTGAASLVRAIPTENWLEPRNRTILNLSAAYGTVMQPHTPTIKTAIFHGDAERDQYFRPRLYFFGQGAFDHNYSQGLDLQQTYSGGVGLTLIQRDNETLDLKASLSYVSQQFHGAPSESLIGSIFGEAYNRKFKHGMILDQHLTLIPTWNNTSAYSGAFNALLTMPVYRRFNASAGFIDSYLNNPPPAFKKNSIQLTIGIAYVLP